MSPFTAPADGQPAMAEPRPAGVNPLPPDPVPTLPPARRLGDRKFVGPGILGPLAVSTDGTTAAFTSGMAGRTSQGWQGPAVVVWDVAAGRELRRHQLSHNTIRHLALSPDGRTLYAGESLDRMVPNTLHRSAIEYAPVQGVRHFSV